MPVYGHANRDSVTVTNQPVSVPPARSSPRIVTYGPDVRTGTGSASFTLTATSTGFKSVARTGTASFTLTATSTGLKGVARTGTASFTLTAASTGRKNGLGTSSAAFTLGTSTTGRKNGFGTGTASFTLTATSTGTRGADSRSGTGSATFTLTASSTGKKAVSRTGSASFTLNASSTGSGSNASQSTGGGGWSSPLSVLVVKSGSGRATHRLILTSTGFGTRRGVTRAAFPLPDLVSTGAKGIPGQGLIATRSSSAISAGHKRMTSLGHVPHTVTRTATGHKTAHVSTRTDHTMTTASAGVGDQAARRRRQEDELLLIGAL